MQFFNKYTLIIFYLCWAVMSQDELIYKQGDTPIAPIPIGTAEAFTVALKESLLFIVSFISTAAIIFSWEIIQGIATEQREWNAYSPHRRAKILQTVAFNLFVSTPIFFFIVALSVPMIRESNTLSITKLPWLAKAFLVPPIVDISFYILHWIAHRPIFYARVHKKHHEITSGFGPAAIYCTLIEMWLINLLPGAISVWLLSLDEPTVFIMAILGAMDTVIAHSRFSLLHYQHHRYPVLMFGSSLGLTDKIFSSCIKDQQKVESTQLAWKRAFLTPASTKKKIKHHTK